MPYSDVLTRTAPAIAPCNLSSAWSPMGKDNLYWVRGTGDSMSIVGLLPFEDAMEAFDDLTNAVAVLSEALVGCSRYMDYMAHHVAFLSGGETREDFLAASREYAVSPSGDIVGLAMRIATILRSTRVDFPPEKLEEFCSATSAEVAAALRLLDDRGLINIAK